MACDERNIIETYRLNWRRHRAQIKLLPFEHGTGVSVFVDTSHHPTVFQSHALQQPVIHVVPNTDCEDAELLLHGWACVPQDRRGLDLPDRGPSVRQENNKGDAVQAGIRAWEVLTKQRGASLDCTVDVCACSEEKSWQITAQKNVNRELQWISTIFIAYSLFLIVHL